MTCRVKCPTKVFPTKNIPFREIPGKCVIGSGSMNLIPVGSLTSGNTQLTALSATTSGEVSALPGPFATVAGFTTNAKGRATFSGTATVQTAPTAATVLLQIVRSDGTIVNSAFITSNFNNVDTFDITVTATSCAKPGESYFLQIAIFLADSGTSVTLTSGTFNMELSTGKSDSESSED
jgi:hypothetical protein